MAYVFNNEEFGVRSFVAGENLVAGNVVYIKASDGRVWKASAAVGSAHVAVGIVVKAASAGDTVDVISHGVVSGFSGLTVGAEVYLSDVTPGAVTSTIPKTYGDRVQVLGVALAADQVKFAIGHPGYINTEISGTSGEAFDAGATIYLKNTDGKLYKALATVGTANHAIGFARDAATGADEEIRIQRDGVVTAGSSLTPGRQVYLCEGSTAGGVTQTAPGTAGDIVQGLGIALTGTTIAVEIGQADVAKVSVS